MLLKPGILAGLLGSFDTAYHLRRVLSQDFFVGSRGGIM